MDHKLLKLQAQQQTSVTIEKPAETVTVKLENGETVMINMEHCSHVTYNATHMFVHEVL